MKGTYPGPMTVECLYQALLQDRHFFRDHDINYLKAATLDFIPCNRYGEIHEIYDLRGRPVTGYTSAGAYRSVVELHDPGEKLEPQTVTCDGYSIPILGCKHKFPSMQ